MSEEDGVVLEVESQEVQVVAPEASEESRAVLMKLSDTCSCKLAIPVALRPWRRVSDRPEGHSHCFHCNAEGSVEGKDLKVLEEQGEVLDMLVDECTYQRSDALMNDHRSGKLIHLYGPYNVNDNTLVCLPINKRAQVESRTPIMPSAAQRLYWEKCEGMAYLKEGNWRCMVCGEVGAFRECKHKSLPKPKFTVVDMVKSHKRGGKGSYVVR